MTERFFGKQWLQRSQLSHRTTVHPPMASLPQAAQSEVARALQAQPGMTSERARQGMVARLRQQGIRDPKVLQALGTVPRHLFVDEALASRAYEDTALPIAQEQTISQPYIVAYMLEQVLPVALPGARVLEIGTGCGYQAAVLAQVFAEVYSIERVRVLHDAARQNLRPLRLPNVRLVFGDGMLGLPQIAPFDAIVIAAAGLEVPQSLLEQLRIGGTLIAPVGRTTQHLLRIERIAVKAWRTTHLQSVRFVPLLAGTE